MWGAYLGSERGGRAAIQPPHPSESITMIRVYPAFAAFVLAVSAGTFAAPATFMTIAGTDRPQGVASHDRPVRKYYGPIKDRRADAETSRQPQAVSKCLSSGECWTRAR